MKKALLILMTLLVLCALAGASDVILIKVRVQLANVRSEPDLGATVVTQLKGGTLLESTGKKGDFYEIAVADEAGRISTGYVHANTVDVVSAETEKPAEVRPEPAKHEQAPEKPISVEEVPKTPASKAAVQETRKESYAPPRTGIGLMAGYALPSGYGDGLAFGGTFYFGFSSNFGVEIAGLRFQSSVDEPAEEDRLTGLSKGTLTVMPVQLSLVARFPLNPRLTPYVLAGAGYFLNKHEIDTDIKSGWEDLGFALEEKLDNSVGFHFGAGLDVFMTPKLAAGLIVKYCMSTAKGTWSLKEVATDIEASGDLKDIGLKPFILGLGLKYFF